VVARFYPPFQTGPGAYPASYIMGTGLLMGVKQLDNGVNHPPYLSAEIKEGVVLYPYSPSDLF